MAHVRRVVHRRATAVPQHSVPILRHKHLLETERNHTPYLLPWPEVVITVFQGNLILPTKFQRCCSFLFLLLFCVCVVGVFCFNSKNKFKKNPDAAYFFLVSLPKTHIFTCEALYSAKNKITKKKITSASLIVA